MRINKSKSSNFLFTELCLAHVGTGQEMDKALSPETEGQHSDHSPCSGLNQPPSHLSGSQSVTLQPMDGSWALAEETTRRPSPLISSGKRRGLPPHGLNTEGLRAFSPSDLL